MSGGRFERRRKNRERRRGLISGLPDLWNPEALTRTWDALAEFAHGLTGTHALIGGRLEAGHRLLISRD
jgi:hypothetical protein